MAHECPFSQLSRKRNSYKPILVDGIPADRSEKSPELGKGPVLVLPKEGGLKLKEVVEAIAREHKIPLQYPTDVESTLLNGMAGAGSDVLMLALPVKFAQTPSEVVDMKDVEALERLLLQLLQSGRAK